jgi:hypothetical protein
MARIVAVHGIANQYSGGHQLQRDWLPALQDGLCRAGATGIEAADLTCAFYGDLFRPGGKALEPFYDASDLVDAWEQELLVAWWQEAARLDPMVAGPDAGGKGIGLSVVQAALDGLSQSSFFAGLAETALIGDLKQVRRYLREPEIRKAARQRVLEALGPDTRVVIGHSLGSVVAYEALCAAPEQPATTLITIGSPLGIRHLIFDQLEPAPQEGLGQWPAGLARWVNIASPDDIVALEKKLTSRFGPGVVDQLVENGAQAHDAKRYLCSREVGDAVAAGL